MKKHLIFVGPPGVGKGSEATIISKKLNIPHISTGDMFRMHFKNQTELGLLAKSYTDKGLLVPDSVTNEMVRFRFNSKDVLNGFILDGYPRNLNQAHYLDQLLKDLNLKVDVVVNFVAPDEVLIHRLSGRFTCPVCGAIYHIDLNPPKKKGFCDKDNSPLTQRVDDQASVVKDRLKVYYQETHPIINYYQKKGNLVDINGDDTIEVVSNSILKVLGA